MGLFDKLKNVLFVEEEVEIPVIDKVTETKVEEPTFESAPKKFDNTLPEFEKTKKVPIVEEKTKENINHFSNVKRDIELDYDFDNDKTVQLDANNEENIKVEKESPFLSFDEEEFEKMNSTIRKEEVKKTSVVPVKALDKEKEEKKVEIPKKFRLSPVISPVYGILDKNYKKEDIVEKADDFDLYEEVESAIDVDSIRKKAYGTLEDDIETNINFNDELPLKKEEEVKLEETEIDLFQPESSIEEEKIDQTNEEVNLEEDIDNKIDDIDSVIEEDIIEDMPILEEEEEVEIPSSNETSDIEDTIEIPSFEEVSETEDTAQIESPNDILEKTNALKILDDIEKELDSVTEKNNEKEDVDNDVLLEDTTETDLFNLIDSMYDDKEEI